MEAVAVQSWETTYTGNNRWYVRLLPSLTDFAFVLPAVLILFLLNGAKSLLSDGDTGWHIRTGEWILEHRAVPTVDLFSFTKTNQPWFAWEWGWDTLFAIVHHWSGLTGVAFVNVAVLCLISALLFRLIRRCSGNDILALVLTLLVLLGSTIHWLARPHLFSWLFVLVFCHAILSASEGNTKALWKLPGLTLLWVNIHGAFFVGIAILLIYAVGEAARILISSSRISWEHAYKTARPYLFCALGCSLVSFVNPYTWHLHQHILRYLGNSNLLDQIQEYQSISFHHGPAFFFECMLFLGAASCLWCVQRAKIAPAILIVMWAHLALVSARNIPIFLMITAPWIASMLQDTLTSIAVGAWPRRMSSAVSEICRELRPLERIERVHLVSVLAVFVMAYLAAKGNPKLEAEFPSKNFPVEAIPVIEARKTSHIFTYDQWGDYLIYRLYPSTKVFFDGRSDFYGADFVSRCGQVIDARYDWETEFKRFTVDTVLLRTDAPLATVLKNSRDWRLLLDNGSIIIFGKNTAQDEEIRAKAAGNESFNLVPAATKRNFEPPLACKLGV